MKLTTNLNLKKPDYTDPVDIGDINGNMDIVDSAIQSKVDNSRVLTNVPSGAKFTDTKVARYVIGTSIAGWTSADCDYLCDGTADQAEINQAIQDLPANGGEIVILDGTYNITSKINITKDNVSIRGNGNATILKRMFDSSVKEGVITLTNRSGCKIADLQIDGNKTSYSNSNNYSIYLEFASNNTITGNTYNNNNYGIYLYNSSSNTITGNTCNNNNNYGIYLYNSSSDTVTGNTCNDNNNTGIYLTSSSNNNTVTGNTCNNNNSGYGIRLNTSSNNAVTGNTCNNSYNNSGINISNNSNDNTIIGNTCNNNKENGIYLEGSSNNTVTGNTCNNNNASGILLEDSSNNTVTGNTCIRGTGLTTDYAYGHDTIRLNYAGNNYNLISNNNCMGKAVTVGGGTGNTLVNNKFDDSDDIQALATARFVIGTSTAGWTIRDCDYLCDGTADDVEINAAITALPANGGEIVILDGTYNITAKIDVTKDNVSIRGNGNATILKRMFDSSHGGVITLSSRSGCKIANLQIDGNKTSYTNVNNHGIYLDGSGRNAVTGNYCHNNNSGIFLLSSSNNNTITSNTCNNNYRGITLDSSSDNTITGNICNYNNNYGISLQYTSNNNTITGNNCNNNASGIRLEYSNNNNNIAGNTCIRGTGLTTNYTASQHTIQLSGTDNNYNLISNNNCMGKAVTNGGGTGNTLVNNKFDGSDDIQALSGDVAAHKVDYVHHAGYGSASDTNAKTITLNPALSSYQEGTTIAFKNVTQNSGAVTINVNGLGAKSVLKSNGNALASGNLKANSVYTVRYNGTNFILQGEGGEYGTATPSDVITGKTIGTDDGLVSGTIPIKSAQTYTPSTSSRTIESNQYLAGTQTISPITGTAARGDVLSGKTFNSATAGINQSGTIPSKSAQTYTPGTSNQTIASGQYLTGTQTISGNANLKAENIKSGVNIFNVSGSLKPAIGYNWITQTPPLAGKDILCLYSGNNIQMCVMREDTVNYKPLLYTRTSTTNWVQRTIPFTQYDVGSIVYGKGLYVMTGTTPSKRVATSSDGISWTLRSISFNASQQSTNALFYEDGLFIVGGGTLSSEYATSTDGISWTRRTISSSGAPYSLVKGNGLWVMGHDEDIYTSTSGTSSWVKRGKPFSQAHNVLSLGYGKGLYVAGGNNGGISTSTNGINWTQRTDLSGNVWRIVYNSGLYLAGTDSGLYSSEDGINWVQRLSGSYKRIAWGDLLLTAGDYGSFAYSSL